VTIVTAMPPSFLPEVTPRHDVALRALERTRRILGTRTETETIQRALDLVLDEAALVEALHRFVLKGRGHVEDVDARC
jgi:hypothetical protein